MNYKIPLISKIPSIIGLPEFYDFVDGCEIKIDNKKYLDFSVIGSSACILGGNDKYVNNYVKQAINKGSFSSLNPKIMLKLTNLLLAINKDSEMVRYGTCAGEMLYLALMLAEEKIKGSIIYQVGYNGWLIKNRKDIKHYDEINDIIKEKERPDIIIFELARHHYPNIKAIDKLNEWQKKGTILINDEVTTGFRMCFSGFYQLYNLNPDMIVYAKSISNGYPFACVVGKEKVMNSNLWISSTYWSTNIGFTAAYYSIKKLKHCKYKLLVKLGKSVQKIWQTCAKKHNVNIKIGEVPNIANFEFIEKSLECKSLFISEMQKYNILASDQFYPSFKYNSNHISQYAKACNKVFKIIRKYLDGEKFEFKLLDVKMD